ncbi:dedicator of cytokinesis [Anaeramoeba ignava]|uniref:Dedicator of cytokinesis n=1 Tax=Anaeramoeba ignava TaxID=1746090 RepID=A0A9Q0LFI6_ANAIG|nr:dedicator of cytokinesis [Anaeramoeba ignava]
MTSWKQTRIFGVAKYKFSAKQESYLKTDFGDPLFIKEETEEWFRAKSILTGKHGIIPKTYVEIIDEPIPTKQNFLARETHPYIHANPFLILCKRFIVTYRKIMDFFCFEKRDFAKQDEIKFYVGMLIQLQKEVLNRSGNKDDVLQAQEQILNMIQNCQKKLRLPAVPRKENGQIINPKAFGMIESFEYFKSLEDPRQQLSLEKEKKGAKNIQLLFEFNAAILLLPSEAEVRFFLYSQSEKRPITEIYSLNIEKTGMNKDIDKHGKLKTVFKDLTASDFSGQLYIVCQILRVGPVSLDEKYQKKGEKKESEYKRPFAVGVLELLQNFLKTTKETKKEETITMYSLTNEANFPKMHEIILNSEQTLKKLDHGVTISWTVFQGDYDDIIKEKEEELQQKMEDIKKKQEKQEKTGETETETETDTEHTISIDRQETKKSTNLKSNLISMEAEEQKKRIEEQLENIREFKNTGFTLKTKFPDVILPSYIRNDLYITLLEGEFNEERKASSHNIEMRVYVKMNDCKDAKNFVTDCISYGENSNRLSVYKSSVYYHKNNPKWLETFRINMPVDQFEKSHLYMEFVHCPVKEGQEDKVISFAFLPFFKNGTMIQQGLASFHTYKYVPKVLKDEPVFYLTEPESQQKQKTKLVPRKEQIKINIDLCSTRLTQDTNVTGLLKWKESTQPLNQILKNFTYAPQNEIVKFIREILDILFVLLEQKGSGKDTKKSIYESIEYVIGIVSDKRFKNFTPVLNDYLQTRFSDKIINTQENDNQQNILNQNLKKSLCTVYIFFIEMLKSKLSDTENAERKSLLSSMKAIEYSFKFIISSWILNITENPNEASKKSKVKSDLKEILALINTFMKRTTPVWINAAQEMALRHFKSIFSELSRIFKLKELAEFTKELIESVRKEDLKGLNQSKLDLIVYLFQERVFENRRSRVMIIPIILKQISFHYKMSEEEFNLCIEILLVILKRTFEQQKLYESKDTSKQQEIQQESFIFYEENNQNKEKPVHKERQPIRELLDFPRHLFQMLNYNDECEEKEIQDALLKHDGDHTRTSKEPSLSRENKPSELKRATSTSLLRIENDIPSEIESSPEILSIKFKRGEIRRKIVTGILSLFQMVDSSHVKTLLRVYDSHQQLRAEFLELIFTTFIKLINSPIYHKKLESLSIFQYFIILKTLKLFMNELHEKYIGSSYIKMWDSYFKALVEFIKSPTLQLESLKDFQSYQIKAEFGDMRLKAAKILEKSWRILDQKYSFITTKVPDFLSLITLDHDKLKELGLNIYYSMLVEEIKRTESFTVVEQSTVDSIDMFIEKKVESKFNSYFFSHIQPKFKENPTYEAKCLNFVEQLQQLMDHLSILNDYPEEERYEDERTFVLLNLMDYLQKTKRYSMYAKYTHYLARLHLRNRNYTEAALCLSKVNDILEFNEKKVEEKMSELYFEYPRETTAERKERIIRNAATFFDKGKFWEKGVEFLNILKERFEKFTFEYDKLSEILKKQSEMYMKIFETERFFSSYFRVGYYGKGFDTEIYRKFKDKEFVYRGAELEQLSVFMEKMKAKFPEAKIGSTDPDDEIKEGNGQYIQISNLNPTSTEEMEGWKRSFSDRMSERIRKYYTHYNVNTFMYSKPFRKSKEKSSNEFKDLWLRNTFFITEDAFPGIKRRTTVIEKQIIEVSPIENAINSVNEKNDELISKIHKYESFNGKNISPFSMAFNGVIDAAVNGGVFKYQEAFFNDEFVKESFQNEQCVGDLKYALKKQQSVLEAGVLLHSTICPEEMKPFHENMEKQFAKMKQILAPSLKGVQLIEKFDF